MDLLNYSIIVTSHASKNWGINTDILDTNVINLAILISALVYLGKDALGNILGNRQQKVFSAIQEAETKLEKANQRLAEATKQLEQTQSVIAKIQKDAEITAKKIRESLLAQGKTDTQRLLASSQSSIKSTENEIRKQIQQQIVTLALKRVTIQLKNQIDDNIKINIIDNNLAMLGVS
uniref:ATP synthase CF0 subunit B n=1 Tax=Porphyridium purpureum TaxID=35688 RepID=W0RYZ9_PORPP|nr:ATP synthase CF0, subunit B [Porphyridium purpureum]ATJ03003.1 ATP synthase CF0 subunit B [Porphyridium purpureum]BAO23791.1 ATP synthase CF0, subunit B [Porphyridium purpureum]